MAAREQKRAQRRKRKARAVEERERIAARYEEKNRVAREALEPLAEDERPAVVTVAAVISAALAVLSIAGFALWDLLRNDSRPGAIGAVAFVLVMASMAYGLWRTRYWAVLGFQAALALVILGATLAAISAATVGLLIGNVLVIAIAGTLFYFMIKAMARIQMPERAPRK
jgi:hypothetical protein